MAEEEQTTEPAKEEVADTVETEEPVKPKTESEVPVPETPEEAKAETTE